MVCCELTETDALYIRLLGTLSRHRRKGVAKAMMARVMQEADRRDINNVYTFVRVDNKVRLELEIINMCLDIWISKLCIVNADVSF